MDHADCLVCQKIRGEKLPPGGPLSTDEWVYASHAFLPPGQTTAFLGWIVIDIRRHIAGLGEMNDEEARSLGMAMKRLSQALQQVTGAERIYAVVSGHAVDHLHLHLIPRYPGTPKEYGITDVDEWPEAPRGGEAEIHRLCDRLRAYLEGEA